MGVMKAAYQIMIEFGVDEKTALRMLKEDQLKVMQQEHEQRRDEMEMDQQLRDTQHHAMTELSTAIIEIQSALEFQGGAQLRSALDRLKIIREQMWDRSLYHCGVIGE